MSRILPRLLLTGGLLAVAGPVLALGLGRIEVRSQHGQPLLAEIPVISSDPAELRALQARLASPDTFTRIGLDPPQGLVSDLQFNVALDPQGRPVIRVTSVAPVDQDALTFLVEVDWGQGRLVREYSALVAVPDTVAAPAQPGIQAPVAAAAPNIVRAGSDDDAALVGGAVDQAAPPDPASVDAMAAEQAGPEPASGPVAAAAPAPRIAIGPEGGVLPTVREGQTLSEIAAPLAGDAGISVNQAMLLLLRTNPEAFIGGNINLVRAGAVLRMPARDAWHQFSAAEANAVVREQVAQWREMRKPAPQPADAVDDTASEAAVATNQGAAAEADARLEITPPSGDSQPAGSQSGIAAGAGGDMLRQELQQANEAVAARNAEIDELKARLDDLEKLQQKQQQLIELKDAELAAAQQRMENSNQQQSDAGGPFPWMPVGLAILVVGALAFVLGRRGRAEPAPRIAPGFAAEAAAAVPSDAPAQADGDATEIEADPVVDPAPSAPAFARNGVARVRPLSTTAASAAAASGPTWHAGGVRATAPPVTAAETTADPAPAEAAPPETVDSIEPAAAAPAQAVPVESEPAPTPAADAPATAAEAAPEPELSPGMERIELARAYIGMGDTRSARSLLLEVVDGDDLGAAAHAAQMLRTLD